MFLPVNYPYYSSTVHVKLTCGVAFPRQAGLEELTIMETGETGGFIWLRP
jgi:hypothetical protein